MQADFCEIAGFVKGAETDSAARERPIDCGKERFHVVIEKNTDRAGVGIAEYPHLVPSPVWKRGGSIDPCNTPARAAIHNEDAVVNRDLAPRIHRQVNVVEVERINIVEHDDHGAAFPPHIRLQIEATDLNILQPRELQGPAGNSGRAGALHVEVMQTILRKYFPVARIGH